MVPCLTLMAVGTVFLPVTDPPKRVGEVTLSISREGEQPAGCPLVVDLKLTNVGKEKISWWCGGPERYPGAEHFLVEVRYDSKGDWIEVKATNGQYTQGSGSGESLATGASIQVPLAIPVARKGIEDVAIRVTPQKWNAAKPAETSILIFKDRRTLDVYRARLIAAAMTEEDSFRMHLAEVYADKFVIDTLIKMLEFDNERIQSGAATVLARQKELPLAAGDQLAKAVREGAPKGWVGSELMCAALLTQSESARKAVLDLLTGSDKDLRYHASDALAMSPGDIAWLRRARAAILAIEKESQGDALLAERIAHSIKWLGLRIEEIKK